MIQPLPQVASVSDMRLHQASILQKAKLAPVLLMERGSKPALVCVSPEMWDSIAKYIDNLECSIDALETELAIVTGEKQVEVVTDNTWSEIERNRERSQVPA